jgi:outer membrane protein OmpA-like peptidoglycan-associated protein
MKSTPCIAAGLLLVAGTACAQTRTTELQARSYIQSAFITGAAHAILSADVALGPRLRERLALPAQAERDRVYEAIFALTEDKRLTVRKSTGDEAASVAPRAAGRPVFALEGSAVPLLMVYDLDRNAIPYVALLGAASASGATMAPDSPKALRVADTAPPAPVLARAVVPTTITLKPIAFAFDQATLDAAAKAALEREGLPKIVELREVRYVVQGHADRLGAARYNQRLSERRAEAVRDYLVEKGVPRENIQAVGLGTSMPQTECAQRDRRALIECLAPDRRVSVEIQPPPL